MLSKKGLIDHPRSLGQHIRNRRFTLGLSQEQVARELGSLRKVYDRWERDERQPIVFEWQGILSFLGYYPAGEETAAARFDVREQHRASLACVGIADKEPVLLADPAKDEVWR